MPENCFSRLKRIRNNMNGEFCNFLAKSSSTQASNSFVFTMTARLDTISRSLAEAKLRQSVSAKTWLFHYNAQKTLRTEFEALFTSSTRGMHDFLHLPNVRIL